MNFLAHCALADLSERHDRSPLIAGGILADCIKGTLPTHWPEPLVEGVRLHRRIDAYSNQHPAIRTTCDRLPRELRRFAPIFIDIYADHLLTQAWHRYHSQPLEAFTARCYAAIATALEAPLGLHPTALDFVDYLQNQDLLGGYGERHNVERGIASVLRRLRRPELLAQTMSALDQAHDPLAEDFEIYFPALIDEARRFVLAINAER